MVYNWYMLFEFDPMKSRANKEKHGIDFEEAQKIWLSPHCEFVAKSDREDRWVVFGIIEEVFWTAVITKRAGGIRIISVRRSRHEEKEAYKKHFQQNDHN